MNMGPVGVLFVLGSKDRPSTALPSGLFPEKTNPTLRGGMPGTLHSWSNEGAWCYGATP